MNSVIGTMQQLCTYFKRWNWGVQCSRYDMPIDTYTYVCSIVRFDPSYLVENSLCNCMPTVRFRICLKAAGNLVGVATPIEQVPRCKFRKSFN